MTRQPCLTCPWRRDAAGAQVIPNFKLELAERLAATCASERGESVPSGQPQFACHQSRGPGEEIVCAGWLAVEGVNHLDVRMGVVLGSVDREALKPGEGWPELHGSYAEVIEKLRATDNSKLELEDKEVQTPTRVRGAE